MPSRIVGHVLDNNRRPVSKVKVLLKGKVVAESGNDGFFSVTLARAASRVALTFATEGYVSNTRVYDSRARCIHTVILWPIAYRVKFDPSRDLDIEFESSRIQVPANALTGPSGKPFTDPVELRFTCFDVTSPFQRSAASGDFSGQLLDRSIRRLNSYGIFDFGVNDLKGRSMSLRSGASIDLAIAVPPKLASNAPRQMGFFDFDALTGRWIQVSNFEFVPSTLTYNGSVTILVSGPHNLDEPQDITCVTIKVVDYYGPTPMPNAFVTAYGGVTAGGGMYTTTGITDSNGLVCLLVQRNASFTVDASGTTAGGSSYGTNPSPQGPFTSPNFSSGAGDCGNPSLCPLVGTVEVDYIIGTGGSLLSMHSQR